MIAEAGPDQGVQDKLMAAWECLQVSSSSSSSSSSIVSGVNTVYSILLLPLHSSHTYCV